MIELAKKREMTKRHRTYNAAAVLEKANNHRMDKFKTYMLIRNTIIALMVIALLLYILL